MGDRSLIVRVADGEYAAEKNKRNAQTREEMPPT